MLEGLKSRPMPSHRLFAASYIDTVALGPDSAHEWLRFGVIATPKHAPPFLLR